MAWQIGQRVNHPAYGQGVVRNLRNKGFQLFVEFTSGHAGWIQCDELPRETEPPRAVAGLPESAPRGGHLGDNTFDIRRIIEALRLGIAPHDRIEELTLGRDEETKKIRDWLHQPTSPAFLIVGEYGSGKTHILSWMASYALRTGWAVAFVETDPTDVPFHKPKRIYHRVVHTLRYRDAQTGCRSGFRQLVRAALERGVLHDHKYFSHLQGADSEAVWEWIEGNEVVRPFESEVTATGGSNQQLRHLVEAAKLLTGGSLGPLGVKEELERRVATRLLDLIDRIKALSTRAHYGKRMCSSLPPLYDYSTASNVYCYLLSGLAWAAQSVGLRGLLVLFDEAESVDATAYKYQLENGRNFLKALMCTARADPSLLASPEETDLTRCAKGKAWDVPFLYRRTDGLRVGVALTPLKQWHRLMQILAMDAHPESRIDLEPLPPSAVLETFERIRQLYAIAYRQEPGDLQVDDLLAVMEAAQDSTRCFMKGAIERLDIRRFRSK